jgi:hypothetical protein
VGGGGDGGVMDRAGGSDWAMGMTDGSTRLTEQDRYSTCSESINIWGESPHHTNRVHVSDKVSRSALEQLD